MNRLASKLGATAWFALIVWSCAYNAQRAAPPKPAPQAPSAMPPASVAAPKPEPEPPLLEGQNGVVGAPRDETAFDYDIELPAANDEPAHLEGTAPVPPAIKRALAGYLESRRATLAGVSSAGDYLVLTRLGDTTQAHRVIQPLGQREQVTFGSEPVQQAGFVPNSPHLVTYRIDTSGNEDYQVLLTDLTTRRLRLLSDGVSRNGPFRWSGRANRAVFTQLAGEADASFMLASLDGQGAVPLTTKPGQWAVLNWSRDESELLIQEYAATTQTRLHVMNALTGESTPLSGLHEDVVYSSAVFTPDSKAILALSNRDGQFVQLWRHQRNDGSWQRLTDHPWDVEEFAQSVDGSTLAYSVNADGFSELYLRRMASSAARRLSEIGAGVISGLRFQGRKSLAFSMSTATTPMDVYAYDIELRRLTRWTRSETGGVPDSAFVDARVVRYPSFDYRQIPALVYQPHGEGPFPVLVWVHGGPEGQTRPAFDPIIQYFAGRLKIAVVAPNIRGSDGYGKEYVNLDNGFKRFDSIRDIGHLLDWIEAQPELDATRVGMHGASYGGYVVLASLVEYQDRIVAGSDRVGISNLVSFLENTSSYRRDVRRKEYGDERDPKMRAYLESISPLNHAEKITSALFVAHGANDPRVPNSEAEAVVERVRAQGQPVWYMLARSEGHDFRKRNNRDQYYQLLATFFSQHLLKEPTSNVAEASATADPASISGAHPASEPTEAVSP